MRLALAVALTSSSAWAGPAAVTLGARVESEAVVLAQDGREARVPQKGMKHAELGLVTLRADGSERAVWASVVHESGVTGFVLRMGPTSAEVAYSVTELESRRGIGSTVRRVWILDLDGDGWNEIVEYASFHGDTGREDHSPRVLRFEGGKFVEARALGKRAPRTPPWRDYRRIEALLVAAAGSKSAHKRGELDGWSERLPSPKRPDTLSLAGGGVPFVGPDLIALAMSKKPAQKFGGRYHVAHLRMHPAPRLISTEHLGEVGFPMSECHDLHESFRREAGAIVIAWPRDNNNFVEQRLPWDGKRLGAAAAPPVSIGQCLP